MTLQGGDKTTGTKILIRTMQDDIKGLAPKKANLQTVVKSQSKAPPPPKLPVSPASQPQPKIIEKPVIKEIIKEVKVPVPVEKIVEKKVFVEKPVIKEIIKEVKVPVPVEKIVEKKVFVDKNRLKNFKQIIIILILILSLAVIGLGSYMAITLLPGQKIIVETHEPESSPEEPAQESKPELKPESEITTGLIPAFPQLVQTKTDQELNLPTSLKYKDYNLLIFPDQKMGIALEVKNSLAALAEMTLWERNIIQDLNWLFTDQMPVKANFKINNWEYPNIIIRYQNTKNLQNSLHYTLINNKLIITTSEQNISLIINALLYES